LWCAVDVAGVGAQVSEAGFESEVGAAEGAVGCEVVGVSLVVGDLEEGVCVLGGVGVGGCDLEVR
jgi:hypothetical protein